ncbi:MAG: hypothetical protein ACI8PZ_002695 [Myxococcota bacterium]
MFEPPVTPTSGEEQRRVALCCPAGLEVHAGVTVAADDRRGRERLVRYTARAA